MAAVDTEALTAAFRACAVSAKVPKFLPYDVALWQAQCEAAFAVANVTAETTKFHHVLAVLDPDVIKRIAPYVRAPTAGSEFTDLVEALSQAFAKSHGDRMDELHAARLGDRRPSDLFYDLERLWLDPNPRTSLVLRYEFKRKLPQSVAVALRAVDHTDCEAFLKRADELVDEFRQQQQHSSLPVSPVVPALVPGPLPASPAADGRPQAPVHSPAPRPVAPGRGAADRGPSSAANLLGSPSTRTTSAPCT